MFTGLVEEVGTIASIVERGGNHRITIHAPNTAKELHEGNSVAVSGVCLTALDIKPESFCADLACGNLETDVVVSHHRGCADQTRIAAQGRWPHGRPHGAGTCRRYCALRRPRTNGQRRRLLAAVRYPRGPGEYVVFKGSIAVEGISLTVAKLEGLRLTIAIIPHTVKMTNLDRCSPAIR